MNVDQKTVKYFESQGYLVGKVECRNRHISRDLWGFIDFVALHPDRTMTVAIQATNAANFANRRKKAEEQKHFELIKQKWDICVIGFKPDKVEPHRVEWL